MPQPDYMQSVAQSLKTVPIDNAAAATTLTVHTPSAGRIFAVYQVLVQAEGITDVTFQSDATVLSGPMAFVDTAWRDIQNNGLPVFKGRAVGESFKITISAAQQVQGFAVVAEMAPTNI